MTHEPLHMVQVFLRTPALYALGRARELPDQVDLGYLLHCALGELFGEQSPLVFSFRERGARVEVLAYSRAEASALREHADRFATPAIHQACEWDALASRPMPTQWRSGVKLGFVIRACPTVRMSSENARHRRGAEVDAFLARAWKAPGEPVDREAVYREWLQRELARDDAALLDVMRMQAFRQVRVFRRTQGKERKAVAQTRPDARLSGLLTVNSPQGFAGLLERGVGRHRAFGFGMLLLRPAGAGAC